MESIFQTLPVQSNGLMCVNTQFLTCARSAGCMKDYPRRSERELASLLLLSSGLRNGNQSGFHTIGSTINLSRKTIFRFKFYLKPHQGVEPQVAGAY